MDTLLLIVLIIVSSLAFITSLIILLLFVKNRNVDKTTPKDSEEIIKLGLSLQTIHSDVISLGGNLQSLKDNVPATVSAESAKQLVELQKTLKEQTAAANTAMMDFQKGLNQVVNERMDKMNETLVKTTETLNKKVDDNFKDINDRVNASLSEGFKGTSDTMGELKKQLGAIDTAQKRLEEVNNQIVSLNSILSGNQTRGAYGELQLEMLLESTFPNGKGKYYNIQDDLGRVKDGEKVRPDADIVFYSGDTSRKLCIDSKFPYADYARLFSGENMNSTDKEALKASFKNAVKMKYKDIASKYLIPETTLNYAVMFIPNDGVFAYVENEFPDLVTDARANNVIISCPSTLQAIIVIFHNAATEAERNKNLEIITVALQRLSQEFGNLSTRWVSLQSTIDATVKKTHEFDVTVGKITKQFDKINKNDVIGLSSSEEETSPAITASHPASDDDK